MSDFSGIAAQRAAGVMFVGYSLQKIRNDAASLLLPPGKRIAIGTYSKRSKSFVVVPTGAAFGSDKVFLECVKKVMLNFWHGTTTLFNGCERQAVAAPSSGLAQSQGWTQRTPAQIPAA